jgi:hypothetical protein
MKRVVQTVLAAVILVAALQAESRNVPVTLGLLKKGISLSATDAEALEKIVTTKPDDEEARIQLLSYYAGPPPEAELTAVKAARARHILWLIENDPKDGLGLFRAPTGVYRMHCQGDDLADPDAFRRIAELWLLQVKKNPGNADIRREAISAIQFCAPEQAEQVLTEANDIAGLGRLYANASLGVTGESYLSKDPSGSDPAFRERPFAEKARRLLDGSTDKQLLVEATRTLLRDGATLWADGKLDWDYTPFGNSLLAKAKSLGADELLLLPLPTKLPARGERPPMTIRVGGATQIASIVRQVPPVYPREARANHIQGVVQLMALIGLDGKVLYLRPDGGPPELIPASLEAVRQWEYKPTRLNDKPCYVVTRIDVNFTLTSR